MHSIRSIRRTASRGFTLVEILIVVIILGILAAIVIPQFTSASTDARNNSLKSLLQTMRSQVELYKLQHSDEYPTDDGLYNGDWSDATAGDFAYLTGKTDAAGALSATGTFGPYLQSAPTNTVRNSATGMFVSTSELAEGDTVTGAAATDGFVVTPSGKIFAIDADGNVFEE